MGKKSLPAAQETNREHSTSSETARVTPMDRYQGLLEALVPLPKTPQRQKMPDSADDLLAEDRYPREVGP